LKIIPLASESLGIRSMATYIETKDCKILIDPSAALGPKRYGLEPHKKEEEKLIEAKKKISEKVKKSDILTISHYHYDHFDNDADFYNGKKVYAKDIKNNINKSQQKRGKEFKEKIQDISDLVYCDNSKHTFGNTDIIFSPPFFHGPENTRLGYVIMTSVDDGDKKILHTSDVQGPVSLNAKKYIISQKPDLLILDGPPTILRGWRFSCENVEIASDNLVEIIKKIDCEIILDHHLLRDIKYKERFPDPYEKGGNKVKTFAEYLGEKNNTLEAHRKQLWGK